jgi:hypothetical protein
MTKHPPRATGIIGGHAYEVILHTGNLALLRLPLPPDGLENLAYDIAGGAADVVVLRALVSHGEEYRLVHPNFTATLAASPTPGKASLWLHPRPRQRPPSATSAAAVVCLAGQVARLLAAHDSLLLPLLGAAIASLLTDPWE